MNKKSIRQLSVLLVLMLCGSAVYHLWLTDRKGMKRTVFPVLGALVSFGGTCSEGAPEWLKKIMFSGLWDLRALASQVAYIDENGKLHNCENGWRDHFFVARVNKDDVFQYGSLTKPVTSAAILMLAKDGRIDINSSIFSVLNEGEGEGFSSKSHAHEVSIGELMRHESGFYGEVFHYKKRPWCPYELEGLYRYKTWISTEGEHKYSNLGYCLLGAVVAKETKKNFREGVGEIFDLKSFGISFADSSMSPNQVKPDYRYHEFYHEDLEPGFDYFAVSSTAGLVGSARSYARLMKYILELSLPGFLVEKNASCDLSKIRRCYGNAFYFYRSNNGEHFNIKEGYMPGFSSVVAVNERNEIFVWLGNSDTPKASEGKNMKSFLDALSKTDF